MMRVVAIAAATVVAILAWAALVVVGSLEGWGREPLATRADASAFMKAAVAEAQGHPGNMSLVLLEDGRPIGSHFISKDGVVDGGTLFQVASLSKWVTAWGVMTLVEDGRIDLDAPVETYLTRWRLPTGEYDNRQVTVRRLLSHTAGLTDGLGYGGFAPGQAIQPLEASLTRAADASPGRDGIVRVGKEPGSGWAYSGGGYTLLQLVVEEVSGRPFADYMRDAVLQPLGMARSTYVLPVGGVEDLAPIFDVDGSPATHYRFTATAAASLYTSADELTRFFQAHLAGPQGEPPGRGVLNPQTLQEMRRPHARQFGADIWGLGLILYAPNGEGGHVIGHDGANAPAINTSARLDPASGDGIIVLETGSTQLATRLAGEWVFWRTGEVDVISLAMQAERMLILIGVGAGVILLVGAVAGWLAWRSRTTSP